MAKDTYHDIMKIALEKEGWSITHDHYELKFTQQGLYLSNLKIDLGAEKLIAAERNTQKIAIEIKTLSGASIVNELHTLIGQFISYQVGLEMQEPDRMLFAAIPEDAYLILAPHPFSKN
jgi:hypothetical protein